MEHASVKENSCLWKVGNAFKPFSRFGLQNIQKSIFHLPSVSQVTVVKGTSKPNISNLSGITNPSAHLRERRDGPSSQSIAFSAC
jgi:hypothetical protein